MQVEQRSIFGALVSPAIAYPEIVWDEYATGDAQIAVLMRIAEHLSFMDIDDADIRNCADYVLTCELPPVLGALDLLEEIATCVALSCGCLSR